MNIDFTFTKITSGTDKMINEFEKIYNDESKGRKITIKDLKYVNQKKRYQSRFRN